MKKRASDDVLGDLHKMVAEELTRRIAGGEASPADMNAAIKFLQNNGIEAVVVDESPLSKLVSALPTFDDEEIEIRPN
jgi:succinylglutamate desuccinylase